MNEPLTIERFRALAEAYGAALERWPAAERKAARELLLRKPELRAVLAEEAELDQLLTEDPPGVSEALLARLDAVVEAPQPFPMKPRSVLVSAIGWAVAAGVGLWLGTSLGEPEIAAITGEDSAALEAEAGDEESSLLELAAGDFGSFEEGL
jgi:hypothetical protein